MAESIGTEVVGTPTQPAKIAKGINNRNAPNAVAAASAGKAQARLERIAGIREASEKEAAAKKKPIESKPAQKAEPAKEPKAGKAKPAEAAKPAPEPKPEPGPNRYLRAARVIIAEGEGLAIAELAVKAQLSPPAAKYCLDAFKGVCTALREAKLLPEKHASAKAPVAPKAKAGKEQDKLASQPVAA